MKIDYLEFTSPDLPATKAFFASAFGWGFNDYGPEYQEIIGAGVSGAGISGGIAAGDIAPPLVILKTEDIEAALARGVLLRPLHDTVYWLPPLVIDDAELDRLTDVTIAAIRAVCGP